MVRCSIGLAEGDARIRGAVEILEQPDGVIPLRLHGRDLAVVAPTFLVSALMSTGIRLELASNTRTLRFQGFQWPLNGTRTPCAYELISNGQAIGAREVRGARSVNVEFELGPGWKDLELWLPCSAMSLVEALWVDDSADLRMQREKPRWVQYGSSISQCLEASRPSISWPALLARRHGFDLLNLAFSGNAHNDPIVARTIRDERADFVVLELGANVAEMGTFTERTFAPSARGFIETILEKHPVVPVVIISPLYQGDYDVKVRPGGITLSRIRQILDRTIAELRWLGTDNLHYIDGLELLGPDDATKMNRRHPTEDAYAVIADRFDRRIFGPGGRFRGLR